MLTTSDRLASDAMHVDAARVATLAEAPEKPDRRVVGLCAREAIRRSWAAADRYVYSPDHKGEHLQDHLKHLPGGIHVDGYAGSMYRSSTVGSQGPSSIYPACVTAVVLLPS